MSMPITPQKSETVARQSHITELCGLPGQSLTGHARSILYSLELMSRKSITPKDAGCQDWLMEKLASLGFVCHPFEVNGVKNLVAEIGAGERVIAFAGHTDVVPPGPVEKWHSDPFEPVVIDNELIGRGAADMKTGVAAMLAASERVLRLSRHLNAKFMWFITSDEEGEAEFGSKEIKAWLDKRNISVDCVIIGEPTAKLATGDTIKVGRRGAISGRIQVKGKQGHVAYPQYADNAIHKMAKVIDAISSINFDAGSDDFPGTSLQITHIDSGDFTDNIVPANCSICFNIRYSHEYSMASLEALIQERIEAVVSSADIQWERPCVPYFTHVDQQNSLIKSVEQAIIKNTGRFPVLSTAGGTSDGRFFASEHTQVVEVGVPNKTIHQVNERIHISDLVTLEDIFTDLLSGLLFD
ncbi:succinyl-diaminopimelate desuccinylase [Planctobacterium marinum]|uniref:Succinyl-diaminopimelate desuccinylase n=1 Tax=Planctobacterium marinum TaxID=1631968 RepID=A0AA48HLC7_9ALTE|nr:succinyl-diaminopimelate desuccinylase [Planctobacterium marinum]